jgi:hypothetical protein
MGANSRALEAISKQHKIRKLLGALETIYKQHKIRKLLGTLEASLSRHQILAGVPMKHFRLL